MGRLADKVAVITGAASGIGAACALRFAAEGARIAGFDVAEPPAAHRDAIEKAAPGSLWERVDVRDEASIERAVAAALAHFGRIEVLRLTARGPALASYLHLLPSNSDWKVTDDLGAIGFDGWLKSNAACRGRRKPSLNRWQCW
jgi:NAD(P)-dependent dehydrogenase (short-subunit alcohol dehydrogenase family)